MTLLNTDLLPVSKACQRDVCVSAVRRIDGRTAKMPVRFNKNRSGSNINQAVTNDQDT